MQRINHKVFYAWVIELTPRICAKGIRMRIDFDDGHGVNLQGRGYNL